MNQNDLPQTARFLFRVFALVVCTVVNVACAEVQPAMDHPQATWQRLVFEASHVLGRATAEVRLSTVSMAEAERELVTSPQGEALLVGNSEVYLLTVDAQAKLLFSRKQWWGRVWFLSEDLLALQRVRLKPGDKGSNKIYRYTQDGVYRVRAEPKNSQEAALPPERWSDVSNSFYPYSTEAQSCSGVLDPLLLLYLVSAPKHTARDELTACVFNKKAVYHATLQAEGSEPTRVSYVETFAGRKKRVEREIPALTFRLRARPLDPENANREGFEFLGLEGDLEILVDPGNRLPVRIRGTLPGAGTVEFSLVEADFKG